MADRIAQFDWTSTPLGAMADWPQSLKTAVDIMLGSGHAMQLAWGPKRTVLYNDAYAPMLGARHPGALGLPFAEAWPEIWDDIEPLVARVFAGETVRHKDLPLTMTRSGYPEQTWWNFSYSPVRDESGAVAGLLNVTVDATGKMRAKRAEAALREREERYRVFVTATVDTVYRMNADWSVMQELDGRGFLADTKSSSRSWRETYILPKDRSKVDQAIRRAIDTKNRFQLDHRVRQADGEIGWTLSRAAPVIDEQGEIVEWLGTATDITARKSAENALHDSQARLQLAMTAGRVGTWEWDAGRDRLISDERLAALFDLDADIATTSGLSLESFTASTHAEDRAHVERAIHAAIQTGGRYEVDYRIAKTDGSIRWVEARGQIEPGSGGRDKRFYGVVTDITERKQAEEALKNNQRQLKEANRSKDQFLAMLGHELRNPLAPIVTTLQLMKLRAPDQFVRERELIAAQTQTLVAMVDDLLDVARIARGNLKLDKQPLAVADVVAEAGETVDWALTEYRQTLHAEVEPGLAVCGDRRRLVQVIVNLVVNAAKYSPPDQRIDIKAMAADDAALIHVRDHGHGMSEDLCSRVFEAFVQTEQSVDREHGGLGLGLAIVRNIVSLHGGSVAAASEGEGKGSRFSVRLPLLRGGQDASEEPAPAQAPAPAAGTATRVLLVDDHVAGAQSMGALLEAMHYAVHIAHDGPAALAAVKTCQPAIALLDIGLPGMDGYELARTLRAIPEFASLPLIALTGYGQAEDRKRTHNAGFDEHVTKPVRPDDLVSLMEKLVRA
jgi:signal transduction histidine kinase